MPSRSGHPCGSPGCGACVVGSRYCEQHANLEHEARNRFDRYRGSSASRGYDGAWQQFREWFLARHPACEDCALRGIVKAATDVHHIKKVADYPELKLVEDNCIALCHEDHSIRTSKGE